ncbi:MAG TPA: hypothetical protein VFJ74_05475 [Gemmatimonadaceae bacterium]|nr:hypothetical protein [Gemmatimonadaceae bacterium]
MSRLAASSRISGASSTIAVAFLLTLAAVVAVLSPRAALAQDGAGAPSAGPGGGTLAVHGYLTQGWGKTSGPQFYGLTDVGSTDFRYAAIQFRYDRKNDGLVVQLNNRRLGRSPITDFESSVNVNWAFYERHLGDAAAVKVGRIPIPRGIYNEQRSIGVLLPLYRAPVVFYDESAYYSETIDGAVVSRTFRDGKPWSVDASVYGGGWSTLAYDQSGDVYAVSRIRAENAIGSQLWLNTPLDGLRLGLAAQRYRWQPIGDASAQAGDVSIVREEHASLDGTFTRWFVRAEGEVQHFSDDRFVSSYAQTGVRVLPKTMLVGEYQIATEHNQTYSTDWPSTFDWHRSGGVGLNFAFAPNLVLKAEHHWDRGIQVEQPANPRDPPSFRYDMVSLSASF